jgi:hypothetical protein
MKFVLTASLPGIVIYPRHEPHRKYRLSSTTVLAYRTVPHNEHCLSKHVTNIKTIGLYTAVGHFRKMFTEISVKMSVL